MLVKMSALQREHWELLSSHVPIHTSQLRDCLQQLDITKGDQIKSRQTLQIKMSISICVILMIEELPHPHDYCILYHCQDYFLCRLQW